MHCQGEYFILHIAQHKNISGRVVSCAALLAHYFSLTKSELQTIQTT